MDSYRYKYRMWDIKHHKMFYPNNLKDNQFILNKLNRKLFRRNDNDLNNYIFMQYTGINDYAFKHIYESDIVRFYGGHFHGHVFGVVEWCREETGYYINMLTGTDGYVKLSLMDETAIIGNVYEHKDLFL